MKTEVITREIFTFEELSEDAKQRAIDNLREINVNYEWWDMTYDNLRELAEMCNIAGFDIEGFDLDRAQSIALSGSVDYADLQSFARQPIKEDGYKLLDELHKFAKSALIKNLCPAMRTVIATTYAHGYRFETGASYERTRYGCTDDTRVETEANYEGTSELMVEQTEECAEACSEFLEELKNLAFKMLSDEFDYLYSDEAVREAIEANDYEFLENGELA